MQVKHFVVNLNSQKPERLVAFYRDTVGLNPADDVAPGAFRLGDDPFVSLIVEGHSEVVGATRDPARVIFNFMVDDIATEHARLEAAGVDVVVRMNEEPGFGIISTFRDPDRNYFQLIQMQG